jgi:hypothetical protein
MPDGSAASGAVVVTSAGGQTVTAKDGSFALEVPLTLDGESLEVTAIASEAMGLGLAATVRLVPAALSRTTSLGQLRLTPSPECHSRWLPTFGPQPGMDDVVEVMTTFDDGSGPVLYAGGAFRSAGGVAANHIARWDGSSWTSLGSGTSGNSGFADVLALTAYDDGSGPALYAGGSFTKAGGVTVRSIAKWDGTSWSALGSGVAASGTGFVLSLAVFDDGSGPALYAGGSFATAGGVAAKNIARWNGSSYRPSAVA